MHDVVVIDHSFVEEHHRKRWRILAEDYPVDVTLIVPELWRSEWFGDTLDYRPDPVRETDYRVLPLPTSSETDWGRHVYLSHDLGFRSLEPDLVHVQYSEMNLLHHQVIAYKKLWARDAEITFHTMNALGVRQEKWHQRLRWYHLKNNTTAALCHYPGCRDSLRSAGYERPIYEQTSYGVDEELFAPDEDDRQRVRADLDLEDRFVVGFVGRLTRDKGVDTLLDALPLDGVDWSVLLVGDGEYRDEAERRVEANGWADRIRFTGYVPQADVPGYMRAMDTLVLGSKTTPSWIDTFPRTTVQAMACETPVVGSDSGAIPYQIREVGRIFPEGDPDALEDHLLDLAADSSLRDQMGEAARDESVRRFGQAALAENFYSILKQVVSQEFEYNDGSETAQFKAYR